MSGTESERTIDLNADLGESETPDGRRAEAALMSLVSSVNIACGGHAGDAESMRLALETAAEQGCTPGAHPSFADRAGFGRVRVPVTERALREMLCEQIGALHEAALGVGVGLGHVKPHGALYHAAAEDEGVARAVFEAARGVDPGLRLIGPAGAPVLDWWAGWGAAVGAEGFADRAYGPDGRLRPRGVKGAVLASGEDVVRQAVGIALRGEAVGIGGGAVPVRASTICLHGDTPDALTLARRVSEGLRASGLTLRALGRGG